VPDLSRVGTLSVLVNREVVKWIFDGTLMNFLIGRMDDWKIGSMEV
jgi:hypothetical protein